MPPGSLCRTRDYAFDANGNRTGLTTVAPTDGTCTDAAGTGTTTKNWAYDNADRLTGGYLYDDLGRATTVPAADTSLGTSSGALTLGYFDTDAIASITQNGQTTSYTLDPAGRRGTSTAGPTGANPTTTVVRHYTDGAKARAIRRRAYDAFMRGKYVAGGSSATVRDQRSSTRLRRSATQCKQRPPTDTERAVLPLVLLIRHFARRGVGSASPHGVRKISSDESIALRRPMATLVAMTVNGPMALRDVKNHLSEVVDQVEREHDRVVITKHGKPAAVVISVDDLASLEETLEIAGRPRLMEQIRDSLGELSAGETEVLTKDAIVASLRS
jgi:prevent-host-death family protein